MNKSVKSLRYYLRFFWFKLFGSADYDRLQNTIISTRLEVAEDLNLKDETRAKVEEILLRAESELSFLNYDGSWRNVNMAKRLLALNYTASRRKDVIIAFQEEASKKLSGWRQAAVSKILKEDSSAEELEYSMGIMDDHFANLVLKSKLKLHQVTFMLLVLFLQLSCIFLFKDALFLLNAENESAMLPAGFTFAMVIPVMLFGSIGSTFNGIISVAKADMRMPDQKANYRYNMIRVILGAITGLILYLFICAGILDVIRVDANNFERILIYAFIAGFSEDYLLELIGKARAKG